jgi:hypothetical protein
MKEIFVGDTKLKLERAEVEGGFVEIQEERYYKIRNYHQMPDFFMTIVSDSDHWMFVSSNGSLTAGRKDRNSALFPYYTDDKIHDYKGITGCKTVLQVEQKGNVYQWEPFSDHHRTVYQIESNLYKSVYGNKIIFEEINHDLNVGFRYGWYNSERFGFIRKVVLTNMGEEQLRIHLLDGLQNILPCGVEADFQNAYSNLLDGYKKNELLDESHIGLFLLSSIPVDRAEPSESLNATTVWSHGLANAKILLSSRQVSDFMRGEEVNTETDIRAKRGAYLLNAELELAAKEHHEWFQVAEVNQGSSEVAELQRFMMEEKNIPSILEEDVAAGTSQLIRIVASSDGLQKGADELTGARHFSNTLFNVMRGGVFKQHYRIDLDDFKAFAQIQNTTVANQLNELLDGHSGMLSYEHLHQLVSQEKNANLLRICYEYLPLTFSRRHGDPSRPWNQFAIETKKEDGTPKLDFQGNWRDIFQNWEALGVSYPGYVEGMISKFVNASTPDGYNPYRITRHGIDWESPDPHDPWAYIGYWGDHQIIYLEKLLELSNDYSPAKLDQLLVQEMFAYANVPYRIKSYEHIVDNPKDTIEFDFELDQRIKQEEKRMGADARLVKGHDGEVYLVNLTEKILVTLLSKLSNFIPEAGIWLNTQRPEWNDANNALVGNGVSMVTLYYLRRFLKFWQAKFNAVLHDEFLLSEEVKVLLERIYEHFKQNRWILEKGFNDHERRPFVDVLGEAGSLYRQQIYKHGFSGIKEKVKRDELIDFMSICLDYLDQSIQVNKRDDGLYHAYNLVSFQDEEINIRYLYKMLEGQVAILSSGYLTPAESLNVLDNLKQSDLFRPDQSSYLLYPDRQLPRFIEKNNIPVDWVNKSDLLRQLIELNDTSIVIKDGNGHVHFNSTFRNASVLERALDVVNSRLSVPDFEVQKQTILEVYEELFDHQSFTGRSGTFYAYEGLGSIYWHMVSKLLLATQECFFESIEKNCDPGVVEGIKTHYLEIKDGIGLNKSPQLYGAFPTDAYSHTPGNAGVKQPGMTGQVKEDVICRMKELGVSVKDGQITFNTALLSEKEFLSRNNRFSYYDITGSQSEILLEKGQLGFTFCQVPVVYSLSGTAKIRLTFKDGQTVECDNYMIKREDSERIFNRTGEIVKLEVDVSI